MSIMEEVQARVDEGLKFVESLPKAVKAVFGCTSILTTGVVAATVFEYLLRVRDRAKYPPRGEIVQTPKGKMHVLYVKCTDGTGVKASRPTIIMDAGVGCWSLVYQPMVDELSKIANVLMFDRFGYGHSEYISSANRYGDVLDALDEVLEQYAIQGPYIYVAHSIAGAFANGFSERHRGDMGGICYLDAMSYRGARVMKEILPGQRLSSAAPGMGMKTLSNLGVLRLLTYLGKLPLVYAYPKSLRGELAATTTKWEWFHSFKLDYFTMFDAYGLNETPQQAGEEEKGEVAGLAQLSCEKDGWLKDLPITILRPDYYVTQSPTFTVNREMITEAQEAQKAMLMFSSKARLKPVEDCSHWIMWDHPDIVLGEINELVGQLNEKEAGQTQASKQDAETVLVETE